MYLILYYSMHFIIYEKTTNERSLIIYTIPTLKKLILISIIHISQISIHLKHDALVGGLEPSNGVVLGDSVSDADDGRSNLSASDTVAGSDQDNEEIHTEDTGGGIVLKAQIDVLVDAEAEAAGLGEVSLLELVLLDLEATVQQLVGLEATDLHNR